MRIVSLVPSLTETVAQLGRAQDLVAVTDYCIHPADVVAALPRIGGTKNPDLAAIEALQPDLVLANTDEQRKETLDALADAPYRVLVTETDTLADVAATWTALGTALDAADQAHERRSRLEERIATTIADAAARPRRTVLVPVWKDPWMAAGGGTYLGDLLAACGYDNVLGHVGDKWVRFEPTTDQAAAEAHGRDTGPFAGTHVHALPYAPDTVLLPTEPYAFDETHRAAFSELGVPLERVHVVDGELMTWWLSKTEEALTYFATLHATGAVPASAAERQPA